jgi:uncharacterized protein (DUF2126 family)
VFAFARGVRRHACIPRFPFRARWPSTFTTFGMTALWGGCTYHVLHPSGKLYAARPADAAEAGNRRAERFQNYATTPAAGVPAVEDSNPNSPMTLDLRWPAVAP